MTFIETATERTAAGTVDQLYAADVANRGYVANYTRVFALRPEVLACAVTSWPPSPPHAPCAQPTALWPTAGCCGTGSMTPRQCAASPPTTPALA
jgi:hypothetical protein